MEIIPQLLLVLLLVFLNAFFVAAEFSLVAVRRTRIDELAKKNRAAKLVQLALRDINSYLSSAQLGITAASLALGWVGEPAVANFLRPYFFSLSKDAAFLSSHAIAVVIAFAFITFLHIVLGEFVPKSLALAKSEPVALYTIAPLVLFTNIFKPFIWILNAAGNVFLKLLKIPTITSHQVVHSEEEIKMLLSQSGQEGAIEKEEIEMVYNVFKLGDMQIKQVMIPRTDIVAFSVTTTLRDIIKDNRERYIHSRFPVYESAIDNVVGFVHIKDVYRELLHNEDDKRLSQVSIIREIISVPENKRADEVLLDMRKKRIHIAIVHDEYGGTAGLVTLEDIIESLVGEIQDEFEKPVKQIQRQKDGSYLIEGLLEIDKVQSRFNLPLRGQGYSTIGGLVFGLLGREPLIHDEVQIGSIIFSVERIDRKRIKTLRLRKEKRRKKTF